LEYYSQRTVEELERLSEEFDSEKFLRVKAAVPLFSVFDSFEPSPAIFVCDIIETLMNLIGHEFYIETLVDAWDSIFTSSFVYK
jgi:hypothetical protein